MPRKRKIVVNNELELNELQVHKKKVMKYLENAQLNESYHNKCTKELKELYEKMKHDDFTSVFILCLKQLMEKDESNHYANTGLKFMAKFVTSFEAEDMHPLFDSVFLWNLKTVSPSVNIRFRLCQFVNFVLNSLPEDGDIEEFQVNDILQYMFDRLKDISHKVRVQAIKALCRLQVREDPNDVVTKVFRFHLEHDPSPLVRFAVLTSIARTVHTIGDILDRLWDVDMKVRRSVFIQMSSFPVNILRTEHRIVLLEQGLEDSLEAIRQIVTKVLLPQWLASYNMDFIAFLSDLKLGENDIEMSRFRNVARLSLLAIFKAHKPCDLIKVLPLVIDEGNNHQRCVALDQLTIELSVFWLTLVEFFQSDQSMSDELEQIIPDLTTYCSYVKIFSVSIMNNTIGQVDRFTSKNVFFTLIEFLQRFDLSDETGRENVQGLVVHLLTKSPCDENHIQSLIKISEKLIPDSNERLQFYVDVVRELLNPTVDVDVSMSISTNAIDPNVEVEIATIKMKLFELKEQETKCIEEKDYEKLSQITEDIESWNAELNDLLTPFLPHESICTIVNQLTTDTLLRILQLIFHGVCSKMVSHLIPSMLQLYKVRGKQEELQDIIRVRVESKDMELRNWALKCTATFGLLYSQLANEAYNVLSKQFFQHEVISIWMTSVEAMFQLICRYGFERFLDDLPITSIAQAQNVNPGPSSPTSNSSENCDGLNVRDNETAQDLMLLFAHYLDSCLDVDLTCALVDGFCMLIIHGRYFDEKVLSKLIFLYHDENTHSKVIQILSIFFETLIQRKKQNYLQLALKSTLATIINDDMIDIQSFLMFIIASTTVQMNENNANPIVKHNPHNDIAFTLLNWMIQNSSHRESHRFISKLMLSLKVSDDAEIRLSLLNLTSELLEKHLDKRTENSLKSFRRMMEEPTAQILEFSSTQPALGAEENELNSLTDDDDNNNSDEAGENEDNSDEAGENEDNSD